MPHGWRINNKIYTVTHTVNFHKLSGQYFIEHAYIFTDLLKTFLNFTIIYSKQFKVVRKIIYAVYGKLYFMNIYCTFSHRFFLYWVFHQGRIFLNEQSSEMFCYIPILRYLTAIQPQSDTMFDEHFRVQHVSRGSFYYYDHDEFECVYILQNVSTYYT